MRVTTTSTYLMLAASLLASAPVRAGAADGADTVGLLLAYEQMCNSEAGWMPDEARTLLLVKAQQEGYKSNDSSHSRLAYERAERYKSIWEVVGKKDACLTILVNLKDALERPNIKSFLREYSTSRMVSDCDQEGRSCGVRRGDN